MKKVFIALQNPDKKYKSTRHNAGSILLSTFPMSDLCTIYFSDEYMNLSGNFVKKILKKENILPENLYVFFDDINLPIGKYIISKGVGASSHNGIKSVQEVIKNNDFTRVRIGVGRVGRDGKVESEHGKGMSDFVLSKLSSIEIAMIQSLRDQVLSKII